jgi:hypothetical protein
VAQKVTKARTLLALTVRRAVWVQRDTVVLPLALLKLQELTAGVAQVEMPPAVVQAAVAVWGF